MNPDENAFPCPQFFHTRLVGTLPGFSKREFVATIVLAGMIAADHDLPKETLVNNSIEITDLLIKKLDS